MARNTTTRRMLLALEKILLPARHVRVQDIKTMAEAIINAEVVRQAFNETNSVQAGVEHTAKIVDDAYGTSKLRA
jgi:hypothetical protein